MTDPSIVTLIPGDKVFFFGRNKIYEGTYVGPTDYDQDKLFVMVDGERDITDPRSMFKDRSNAAKYAVDVLDGWLESCQNEILSTSVRKHDIIRDHKKWLLAQEVKGG